MGIGATLEAAAPETRVTPEAITPNLASLVWAKLILGRFRDAVLPDFLDFLLVLTITLTRFSMIPVMGDIAVDIAQGHRICVRVFCLLYS